MDPTNAFKEKIGQRLTLRLAQAVQNKEITPEELPNIASYILENIDNKKTNAELVAFLDEISVKWPFFADTATSEKETAEMQEKNQKTQEITNQIQQMQSQNDQNGGQQ